MFIRGNFAQFVLLCFIVCSVQAGCETLHNAGVPGLDQYVKKDPVQLAREQSFKDEFALHRDHKSFYWLLSHKVSNGMSLGDVEDAIGESGEPTSEFSTMKSDGLYQATDTAYRWGPDNMGYSAIIFFRDSHVVNFNPKDYQTARSVPKLPAIDPQ